MKRPESMSKASRSPSATRDRRSSLVGLGMASGSAGAAPPRGLGGLAGVLDGHGELEPPARRRSSGRRARPCRGSARPRGRPSGRGEWGFAVFHVRDAAGSRPAFAPGVHPPASPPDPPGAWSRPGRTGATPGPRRRCWSARRAHAHPEALLAGARGPGLVSSSRASPASARRSCGRHARRGAGRGAAGADRPRVGARAGVRARRGAAAVRAAADGATPERRDELLGGAAAWRAASSGSRLADAAGAGPGRPRRSRSCTGSTGSAPTWPSASRCSSRWTTPTGPTRHRCACWPTSRAGSTTCPWCWSARRARPIRRRTPRPGRVGPDQPPSCCIPGRSPPRRSRARAGRSGG